jgi:hypothetical protein
VAFTAVLSGSLADVVHANIRDKGKLAIAEKERSPVDEHP